VLIAVPINLCVTFYTTLSFVWYLVTGVAGILLVAYLVSILQPGVQEEPDVNAKME